MPPWHSRTMEGIARLPSAGGECAAVIPGRPAAKGVLRFVSDVDKDEVRVVMIITVSPSPICWVCSLSVLRGAARSRLRTCQCPLLWGRAIPRGIAVMLPVRERWWDERQYLGAWVLVLGGRQRRAAPMRDPCG